MNSQKMCNVAKLLALQSINKAGSGHSGIVMSCGEIMQALFERHLKICSINPDWAVRDRFVLSAGHGSAIYYSYLYMLGFLSLEDIKNFRQINSNTPGHPEITTLGVDCSTGPLGQGIANAVGMAIAETMINARMKDFSHYTYCLCGDGCLMEGVALEAISLAGNLCLNKLILLYDMNSCTLDAELKITNTEDIKMKFLACNFNVLEVDGHNIDEIDKAIIKAKKCKQKPSVIICKTIIGKDTKYANSNISHGKVLSLEELRSLEKLWGIKGNFSIPLDVKNDIKLMQKLKVALYKDYNNAEYKKFAGKSFNLDIKPFGYDFKSTRELGGIYLQEYAKFKENIISLSADVFSSTKTKILDGGIYSKDCRLGRNIYCGIREHAMAGIANGIALHGEFKVVVSTFLAFVDYMRPAIRMSALMNLDVIYVLTHDSVVVGQDGATHQPVEQIDSLELIPNLTTIRPCDENEVIGGLKLAFEKTPSVLIMSRQNLKRVDNSSTNLDNGAYFVLKSNKAKINIFAQGSEVGVAIQLADRLKRHKILTNIISCPVLSLFNIKDLPCKSNMKNIAISYGTGWAFLKKIGNVFLISNSNFGKSGKEEDVLKFLGLDVDSIEDKIMKYLGK